jgi:hypothetical protein
MDSNGDSFRRWQAITINQLTYAADLLLGFAVATIGFVLKLLLDGKFDQSLRELGLSFYLAVSATLLIAFSAAAGIALIVNRLYDFRTTATIARRRDTGASKEELASTRLDSSALGRRTWRFFWFQLISFGFGIGLLLTTGIVISTLRVFDAQPIEIYAGVSLGMSMSQVEYAIGNGDYVSNPDGRPVSEKGELRTESEGLEEWQVRKYLVWEFGKPYNDGPEIEVEFDSRTLRVKKVTCDAPRVSGHCPPLVGLQDGMTGDQVSAILGTPSTRRGSNEAAVMTYRNKGVFVIFIQDRVVAYGIDIEAQ